ncbi:MAG TPA: response regulator transcription factor, partial [Actinopolymorphaceae bacterium]
MTERTDDQVRTGSEDVIRVVVVDDHGVVRQGLRAFLDLQDDIEVAGEGADGAEAIALVESLRPDVLMLDLQMPNVDGVEALRTLRDRGLIGPDAT